MITKYGITLILAIFCSEAFPTSCEYSEPVTKFLYGKTIDTIGDSITWFPNLRCLLRDKGLRYDYVGNIEDKYGFMHDGVGGNGTQDIINRLPSIPYADAYCILAGTNDGGTHPYYTINNLFTIASFLHVKNPRAPIFINSLLPTTNMNNVRNKQVNEILLLLDKQKKLCQNCVIIDAGMKFYNIPNWQNYIDDSRVHLTDTGYEVYTDLVVRSMSKYISIGNIHKPR